MLLAIVVGWVVLVERLHRRSANVTSRRCRSLQNYHEVRTRLGLSTLTLRLCKQLTGIFGVRLAQRAHERQQSSG
jgi:hypothetical protein